MTEPDLFSPILAAIKGGQYFPAAALALVLAVAMARKYGAKRWPILRGDTASVVMTFAGAFGAAAASAGFAGVAMSGALSAAFGLAVTAAGGYAMLAKFALPFADKLAEKYKVLAPVNALLHWMIDRKTTAAKKIETAEKAGNEAVAKNPGKGAAAILGGHEEIN